MNNHSHFDAATLEACPSLKAIVFLGTGTASFIDLEAAAAEGITVRADKGYGDRSVAEHADGADVRRRPPVPAMDAGIRAGRWGRRTASAWARPWA